MGLESKIRSWQKRCPHGSGDGGDGYLLTTDPRFLQVDAVNEALASDMMWWSKSLPREDLARALRNSMCFGLYVLPPSPCSTTTTASVPRREEGEEEEEKVGGGKVKKSVKILERREEEAEAEAEADGHGYAKPPKSKSKEPATAKTMMMSTTTSTSTGQMADPPLPQVGLIRVVTDDVTFAYVTDVYILEEHQGRGLGRWMMECLGEVVHGVGSWPHLRRLMLLTSKPLDLYTKTLGVREWAEVDTTGNKIGLVEGPAAFSYYSSEGK